MTILYNNNPYEKYPTLRDEELAEFREHLRAEGIEELAFATYPKSGVDAGYTYAMVIKADLDQEYRLRDIMSKIMLKLHERMKL